MKNIKEVFENDGTEAGIIYAFKQIPKYPTQPSKPFLATKHNSDQLAEYVQQFKLWETEMEKYKISKEEYNNKKQAIDQEIENGLKTNTGFYQVVPEQYQNKVWAKAWRDGHSEGWNNVEYHLNNLIEIFDI